MPGMSIGWQLQPAARLLHQHLDLALVEASLAQHLAELLAGLARGVLAHQRIEHALLGGKLGSGLDLAAQALARHRDRGLQQIAHDLLDVAADIADLGELRRLDLDERGPRELRQAARDLGLAAAGGADHQDVLGQHLFAQLIRELQAAPAVAQRHRDRALGGVLADDVAVELRDDLARAERLDGRGGVRVGTHVRLTAFR